MTDLLDRPAAAEAPDVPAARVHGRHRRVEPPRRRRPPAAPPLTAAALASAVLGLLALGPWPAELRAVLLAGFVLTGPGLAIVLWMRLPSAAAVAAVPVTGMAAVAGTTAVLGWTDRWVPIPLLLAGVSAVAGSALLHAARHRGIAASWPVVPAPDRWRVTAPYLCIVAALCGWVLALPGMATAPDSPLGLLFTGTGPVLAVVTAVLVGAFVTALRDRSLVTATAAIGALVAVLRMTATLITDLPLYPWTYKHLGIVDFLVQNHALPPSGVDVYREWPAFFTSFAWFSDITALDPTVLAHWFAPVTHLVLAFVVAALAAAIGLNRRETLAAVAIAELANWVAQDYFAPQAFAFTLGLGVIVLLISTPVTPAAGWLALVLFAALVPTHQLTPIWVFAVVVLLAATGRVRPRALVIPFAALLAGYLIPRRDIVFQHGGLSSMNPLANGAGNVDYAGSAAKMFTSAVCRGLSATVVLLAVVAAVVWWRKGRPVAVPVVLAFSSFGLLLFNSYGGEAIFRVYLYAVPGCAVLIAPLAVAGITGGVRQRWAVLVTLAGVGAAGLQGYYGTWPLNVQKPTQLALVESIADSTSGPATVWNLHTAGFPGRSTAQSVALAAYDDNFDAPIFSRWPGFAAGFPDAGHFDDVTAQAAAAPGATFFVFSDEAKVALDYFGYADPGAVDRFEDMFAASPQWCLRGADATTTVYRYQEVCP